MPLDLPLRLSLLLSLTRHQGFAKEYPVQKESCRLPVVVAETMSSSAEECPQRWTRRALRAHYTVVQMVSRTF